MYTSRSRASPVACCSQRNSLRKPGSSCVGNTGASWRWTVRERRTAIAQLVQVLVVGAADRSGDVVGDDRQQPPQHRRRRGIGALVVGQRDVDLGADGAPRYRGGDAERRTHGASSRKRASASSISDSVTISGGSKRIVAGPVALSTSR